jgi:hypothetical protein
MYLQKNNAKKMKKILLLVLTLCSYHVTFAQFSRPVSVGVGAGTAFNLTDLATVDYRFGAHIDLDYLITPFISAGVHVQKGTLSGYRMESDFENNYFAFNGNAKVRLGQFLAIPDNYSYYNLQANTFHKILSNVYIGVGIGAIKNDIQHTIAPDYRDAIASQGGEIEQKLDGFELLIPINIGLDIPFGRTLYGPKWAINLNYQHNLTTNDNLDGVINRNNDHYGYISLGVKYGLFQRR